MTDTGVHLTLHPDRCNQCGRCVPACPVDAIRVGPAYIAVDWKRCTRCFACVSECKRQAIQKTSLAARGAASSAVVDTSKVVVGSRAEAKAVRKAAEKAAKSRGKSVAYGGKPAATTGGAATAVAAVPGAVGAAASASRAAAVPAPTTVTKVPERSAEPTRAQYGTFVPGTVAWTLLDLLLVLGVLLATVLGKDAVLGLNAVALMPWAGRTIVRAAVLAVYYCVQLAALAWLAGRHGATLSSAFGFARSEGAADARTPSVARPSAVGSLGLVVLLFAATEAFAIAYGLAMQSAGLSQPERLSSDLAEVFGSGGAGLALSILLVAVVAPFVEEMSFRGVALPVFGGRWGMWPAILLSSAVFAGYHFSLWLFAPTLVLGIALGWLAWTRRSLWPAILLHVLYNAAAVGAAFIVSK